MWTLALLLPACATLPLQGGRSEPAPAVETYDLTLDADFVTRGEGGLAVDLAPTKLQLVGRVSLSPSIGYRDGSEGRVLRFDTLIDQATGAPHGLAGRAFELRGFASGEVLELRGLDHLAGLDRHGEVLDVLVPLLSPKVPELGRQDRVVTSTSYPVVVAEDRGHRVTVVSSWTSGVETRDGQALHYEGQLRCDGEDGGLRLSCAGSIVGDLSGARDGGLAHSAVVMTRTFVVQGPGGTLVQEQNFDATATRRSTEGPE